MATFTNSGTAWNVWVCFDGTSSNNTTWSNWISAGDPTTNYVPSIVFPPEQVEQQRIQMMERAAQARRDIEEEKRTEEKAIQLLEIFLTPEQIRSMKEQKAFVIKSELGSMFRLREKNTVEEIDGVGNVMGRYCIAPVGRLPAGDVLLAQKLMLEGAEREFRRIANFTAVRS